MSMLHKAFIFHWDAFRTELGPLLAASLHDLDTTRLIEFADRHRRSLRDPYDSERLSENWADQLEVGDVQEVGDFLLTKYYDPKEDRGLGEAWLLLEDSLDAEQRQALLGQPFGPEKARFDPGRIGSYFQNGDSTRRSLETLRHVHRTELSGFLSLLEQAVTANQGLYVTF